MDHNSSQCVYPVRPYYPPRFGRTYGGKEYELFLHASQYCLWEGCPHSADQKSVVCPGGKGHNSITCDYNPYWNHRGYWTNREGNWVPGPDGRKVFKPNEERMTKALQQPRNRVDWLLHMEKRNREDLTNHCYDIFQRQMPSPDVPVDLDNLWTALEKTYENCLVEHSKINLAKMLPDLAEG